MFECCLRLCGDKKYTDYYDMIKNCDTVIRKNLNIGYLIKKHFEIVSMKSLLMTQYPFKGTLEAIDVYNPKNNQSIMDEVANEFRRFGIRKKEYDETGQVLVYDKKKNHHKVDIDLSKSDEDKIMEKWLKIDQENQKIETENEQNLVKVVKHIDSDSFLNSREYEDNKITIKKNIVEEQDEKNLEKEKKKE